MDVHLCGELLSTMPTVMEAYITTTNQSACNTLLIFFQLCGVVHSQCSRCTGMLAQHSCPSKLPRTFSAASANGTSYTEELGVAYPVLNRHRASPQQAFVLYPLSVATTASLPMHDDDFVKHREH